MSEQTQALALAPPRLPYHPALQERFGVSLAGWRTLIDSVFPSAKTPDGVILALSYCQARGLDVFKRPVHVVPMWSSALKRSVETVWPGIAEVRTTAMRTGEYAGIAPVEYGPTITKTFTGSVRDRNDRETTKTVEVSFPEWAQVSVFRIIGGHRVEFAGPKVYWLETYSTASPRSELPNDRWVRAPFGQIEKCAEAAALRRAFPEEASSYTAEEMEGKVLESDAPPAAVAAEEAVASKAKTIADALRARRKPEVVEPAPPVDPEPDRLQEAAPLAQEPAPATPQDGAPENEPLSEDEPPVVDEDGQTVLLTPPAQPSERKLFTAELEELCALAREARLGSTPDESEEVLRDHVRMTFQAELEDLPFFLVGPVKEWLKKPVIPRPKGTRR